MPTSVSPVLVIHGGAGATPRAEMTPERSRRVRAGLLCALRAGHAVLLDGGTSLAAVEQAVRVLEDDPLFNAGCGAVFTADATVELDASIMDGATRAAGSVACVQRIRNPVSAARTVMERSPHVLLVGPGAEAFAAAHGCELVAPGHFHTQERLDALRKVQRAAAGTPLSERDRHGTVGAVALDVRGHLAAATSTGGRTNQLPGRVGDSPVIGAGTWADDRVAVSATGDGEIFLRCAAAHAVATRIALAGEDVDTAARRVLAEGVAALGGTGGLIAVDRAGRWTMPFNTEGMYRGRIDANCEPWVAIYDEDG